VADNLGHAVVVKFNRIALEAPAVEKMEIARGSSGPFSAGNGVGMTNSLNDFGSSATP
jgi:hypothetical protein